MTALPIPLVDAAEVFVRGFAHVRSMAYPYGVSFDGGVWMLRDEPDREKARASELTAIEPTAEQVGARVAAVSPALRRWMLCYLEPRTPMRPARRHRTGGVPRRYAAMDGTNVVGWVSSVRIGTLGSSVGFRQLATLHALALGRQRAVGPSRT